MSDHTETVRSTVSEVYAKAVTKKSAQSCCSAPEQKGMAVKLAGYEQNELNALPAEAVINSFGCGNPLAYSEVAEGDVVLDLGSGAGIDLLIAAKKVGPTGRVIGVDMTDEMIAKAHENITAAGFTNVEVRKGIIEDMPVESSSVDWVISNCVINLSPEKPKVFAEIARVLKPGGRMLVSDIVVDELPDWMRENNSLYCSCVGGAISEADYIGGLERAGLEDVEIRGRLVYETSQIKGFLLSELNELEKSAAEKIAALAPESVQEMAEAVTGKIASLLIFARRRAD